ncbi:MAG: metal ABC transporter permease [Chlamydiae bacterium]|nr:metal ABC transporter permease [Chlamydiota bacterium]
MNFLTALFTTPFLYMSLLAGIASSISSGIIGSYVVVKRIVFISGSIAHSVLGGMGFCVWLKRLYNLEWLSPLHGAIFAALLSAMIIGWIHLKYREREDTVIASIWSTGMAVGVIFISITPGYNVELMNYLFGNILWVTKSDLVMLFALDVIAITIAFLLHQKFLAICFDEQQAKLQNLSVNTLYLALLCLIALSVVLLIQVVGAILIIAMLAIPPAIASNFTKRLSHIMIYAIILGFLFSFLGIALSFHLNWPAGATIALIAALFYLVGFSIKKKVLQ